MVQTFNSETYQQLEHIGFEPDEIALFDIIHQFKEQELLHDVQELIREYSFKRMMAEATHTWKEKRWTEETVFDIVERHRKEKQNGAGGD